MLTLRHVTLCEGGKHTLSSHHFMDTSSYGDYSLSVRGYLVWTSLSPSLWWTNISLTSDWKTFLFSLMLTNGSIFAACTHLSYIDNIHTYICCCCCYYYYHYYARYFICL